MGSEPFIGELVNNYRIVSALGEGGMGAVYLAQHPFMGRKVAIKILRREFAKDDRLVERFMNEARAANAIRHPNIIDIIDVGHLPSGIPYLMMEYLDGENLTRRITRERVMAVGDAADVGVQTASALSAAHEVGIVHRDLKPDNLYLVNDKTQPLARVKVLDFGIAKLRGELSGSGEKTQTGSVMGTPPYMSPEQCRGVSDDINHRSDIYSLGIILYEMLSGAPPFVAEGWGDVALMHIGQPPPPLRARNPEVQSELETVIFKALAKDPNKRWASMSEFGAALRDAVPLNSPRGHAGGTLVASASGGTALLPVPTTLRSATGEVASEVTDSEAVGGRGGASQGRRRSTAIALAGAGTVAAIAVAMFFWGRPSPSKRGPAAISFPSSVADMPRQEPANPAHPPSPSVPTGAPIQERPVLAPKPESAPPVVPVGDRPTAAVETPSPPIDRPKSHPAQSQRATTNGVFKSTSPKKMAGVVPNAAASAKPAPPARANCNPNFFMDALGDKHFKPECFLNAPPTRKSK